MNFFVPIILVASAFFIHSDALKVSVYYEALCPDSVNFIVRQLYPHHHELENYIDLDLVPYGKATVIKHRVKNGSYEFFCQHGPAECRGNKYQSCVLAQNNGQHKDVEFVACLMSRSNPHYFPNVEMCANRLKLNVDNIKTCSENGEGEKLLAQNGVKTLNLNPAISFVPTIIYDDVYDDNAQWQSLQDFVGVVCSKINGIKPSICDRNIWPGICWC